MNPMFTNANVCCRCLEPANYVDFFTGKRDVIFFSLFKLMTYYKKIPIMKTFDVGQGTKMSSRMTAPYDS